MKWPKIHKKNSADDENPKKGQDYRSARNTEDAELAILSNLEAQGLKTTSTEDGFRPAIPGERAPLNVGSLGHALHHHDPEAGTPPGMPKKTFKEMAQKVMTAQAASKTANGGRRAHNILTNMERRSSRKLDGRDVVDFRTDVFAITEEPSNRMEKFPFDVWVDESTDSDYEPETEGADDVPPSESHPLLGNKKPATSRPTTKRDQVLERLRSANPQAYLSCWRRFLNAINPINVLGRLLWVFLNSSLLFALLFLALSWVLFYHMGNPELDFLPGNENLSWWMDFACRQLLLLELARFTQFILIDIFAMSSRLVVKIMGPWVTIFCLQSKGWPFLLTWWGIYDLVFLHGNNNFQRHWLFWTNVEMFQLTEQGGLIMNSELYLRVLAAMVIVGILTTIKRTILTLYFGKRSFENYKPKLEQLLSEMIVVTELAELAAEADVLTGQPVEGGNLPGKRKGPLHARWASLQFHTSVTEGDSPDMDLGSPPQNHAKRGLSPDRFSDRSRSSASNLSGLIRIKNQLDRWEEPVNKMDKRDDSTVKDILRFRQALTYMDLEHPFGEAFGPASNRDELIQSAERLYERLLKLDPDAEVLPYSVLMVLTENKDGTTDLAMKKSIKNIFRADANKQIALLPFVQSCDFVYRQLRYFRASVGNSSVIDRVLESIINTAYMFGLTMLVLVLLNLNPWPLVVSTSTLLVSFAFAIGPTVAKAIEGILLIVGARPYDIGDRIIIADTAGSLIQTVGQSWFVEDITLTRTTLRCGPTNEVASINNAAIAMARITNCARSKNAITMMQIRFDLRFHEGDNVTRFESRIEDYIQKHPDIWDSVAYFRCDDIDTDRKCTTYILAVRSRRTWQPAARVLTERGRLLKYCNEVAEGFGMAYLSPDQRYQMYIAGQNNAVQDDEPNLAHPSTWFGMSTNENVMEGNTDGPVIALESVMPE